MITIELEQLSTNELADYDRMMLEASLRIEKNSRLAMQIWSQVLQELSHRKVVTLVSGSFDDVGNALIRRTYQ